MFIMFLASHGKWIKGVATVEPVDIMEPRELYVWERRRVPTEGNRKVTVGGRRER